LWVDWAVEDVGMESIRERDRQNLIRYSTECSLTLLLLIAIEYIAKTPEGMFTIVFIPAHTNLLLYSPLNDEGYVRKCRVVSVIFRTITYI
jgi:hypothetical protein